MLFAIGGALVLVLIGLLFLRDSQSAESPAVPSGPEVKSPGWRQPAHPPPTPPADATRAPAKATPSPAPRTTVRNVGPTTGQIALGVFLGMWLFVSSVAVIGFVVAAIVVAVLEGSTG